MKLLILDGNSIINRAYFGIHNLTAPDGTPTNAVYGFFSILHSTIEAVNPDAVCVAFDRHAPTFRHLAYSGYKAKRAGMPEDLAVQLPITKELLTLMNIRTYEIDGYEADDILGTVASGCEKLNWECVILTGDKDSLQLVTDKTTVCNIKTAGGKTVYTMYTPDVFMSEYGFDPIRLVDLKALMGDSSDNIPGVPGVGEKTAKQLIGEYGSLEYIYSNIASLPIRDSLRAKLSSGEESAWQSFWLATIFREVPVAFSPEENLWNGQYKTGLYERLLSLGLQKFITQWKIEKTDQIAAPESITSSVNTLTATAAASSEEIIKCVREADYISVIPDNNFDTILIYDGKSLYRAEKMADPTNYRLFLEILFSASVRKVGCNIKEIMRGLLDYGIDSKGFIFDVPLAEYLLDATRSTYEIDRLSQKYLFRIEEQTKALYDLYPILEEELNKSGLRNLYYSIELPLCPVLADMEKTGFLVDKEALYTFSKELDISIDVLKSDIYALAGHEFNINSPKQLGDVLFGELMLPAGKKTKTGWSTNAEILEKSRGKHPIINQVLEYRMLSKLKSTYAEGLLRVVDTDGRIRSNFQMTVTATGRLSSTEPNLQNIPIRKELGSQIRRMFVAAPGKILIDADYSQIELRILAHIAQDDEMCRAFESGEDFHRVTASKVFGIPLEQVTSTLRSRAKAVNFGIVYGISAFSLAQDLNVSAAEAKAYIEAYLTRFSGVSRYMEDVVQNAREKGYVETLYGRRRYLPELKDSKFSVRQFGERVALNMPVQGTAADIIKLAMIHVHKRLAVECPGAKLLLQVHDELIVECDETEGSLVMQILQEEMENAASLRVKLTVEVGSGYNWAEAH